MSVILAHNIHIHNVQTNARTLLNNIVVAGRNADH